MKRTLALTVCLGLALPFLAHADDKDKAEKEEQRALKKLAKQERKLERRQEQGPRREFRPERRAEIQPAADVQAAPAPRMTAEVQPQVAPRMTAETQPAIAPQVNTEVVRRDIRSRNLERRGPRNHLWSYDEARRYHRRDRRDRNWWRSNYSRFALFGGGYYYWDRGYWYPAYGYDPAYSTYIYDEPIYGYNQMEPRQVLVNVQRELRRMGYYRGAIDGLIGPMTRSALTRFQRDNGLPITRRIDGPTLAALGVV